MAERLYEFAWSVPDGTEYRWQTVNPAFPGEMGDYTYPERVELQAKGRRGDPDVTASIEWRDGVPEVVALTFAARAGGRAVRSSDLNAWAAVEALARRAMLETALPVVQQPGEPAVLGWPHGPETREDAWLIDGSLRDAQARRVGPNLDELTEVARVYADAIDGKPVEAVLERLDYGSRRTAARRVQQARDAGLLPPTTRGKKNA